MKQFKYIAKNGSGKSVEAVVTAASAAELASQLSRDGLFPITIERVKSNSTIFSKVRSKELTSFTHQLATLIKSGATLSDALISLIEDIENPTFKDILNDVFNSVKDGMAFSQSLEKHDNIFPQFYCALIKTGELSGTLGDSLAELASFLEEENEFKSQLFSVLMYPALIMGVGFITVLVLFRFIVPRIVAIFDDLGQTLPTITKVIVSISDFTKDYGIWIIFVITVMVIWIAMAKKNKRIKKIQSDIAFRIPFWKDFLLKKDIYQISRTLSVLLSNGVRIGDSLTVVLKTVNNETVSVALRSIAKDLQDGNSLAQAFDNSKIFPKSFINVIRVGESSGELDNVLAKVSVDYKKDVNRSLSTFMGFLEPVLILGVGLIVGIVVIAMLLPIFEIDFGF